MEDIPKVEVKMISREAVKPSIPTPSHLKTLTLSYVDQMLPLVPPFLSSGLVFYTCTANSKAQTQATVNIITQLKSSLSKALSKFYPLAGRVQQSTISCNDQGIPFFVTKVNCSVSTILNSPYKLDFATMFLPPRESLGIIIKENKPVVEVTHLAIQINVFSCGGIAIGWYDIHKVMDGTSSATFFKYWAALSSKHYFSVSDDVVEPDFFATIAAFPPSSKPDQLLPLYFQNCNLLATCTPSPIVVKNFIFRSSSISYLKTRAASNKVPNPSSYQALAGFIWEQLLLVSHMKQLDDDNSETVLQVTVDMRPFIKPPLPKGSIGNLVNTAVALANKSARLPDLVAEINAAVLQIKDEIKEKYKGEKGAEAIRGSWDKLINTLLDYKERAYKVVSWCKLGFYDLDFGFGKPKWMVPTDGIMSPFHRNLIILNNYNKDIDGSVEGWFFLEKKDMEFLESNHQFLALATPA